MALQSSSSVSAGQQKSAHALSKAATALHFVLLGSSVGTARQMAWPGRQRQLVACGGGTCRFWQSKGHQLSLTFEGRMSTLLMIMIMTAAGMLRSVQQDLVQLCAVVGLCNYKVLLLYLSIFFCATLYCCIWYSITCIWWQTATCYFADWRCTVVIL